MEDLPEVWRRVIWVPGSMVPGASVSGVRSSELSPRSTFNLFWSVVSVVEGSGWRVGARDAGRSGGSCYRNRRIAMGDSKYREAVDHLCDIASEALRHVDDAREVSMFPREVEACRRNLKRAVINMRCLREKEEIKQPASSAAPMYFNETLRIEKWMPGLIDECGKMLYFPVDPPFVVPKDGWYVPIFNGKSVTFREVQGPYDVVSCDLPEINLSRHQSLPEYHFERKIKESEIPDVSFVPFGNPKIPLGGIWVRPKEADGVTWVEIEYISAESPQVRLTLSKEIAGKVARAIMKAGGR